MDVWQEFLASKNHTNFRIRSEPRLDSSTLDGKLQSQENTNYRSCACNESKMQAAGMSANRIESPETLVAEGFESVQ